MPYKSEYFNKQRKPPAPSEPDQPSARKGRSGRRKGLRPMSKKRAKLMREVGPERKAFVESAWSCMVCYMEKPTDCHEIARGPAREKALSEPSLWLAVCRRCHELLDD